MSWNVLGLESQSVYLGFILFSKANILYTYSVLELPGLAEGLVYSAGPDLSL